MAAVTGIERRSVVNDNDPGNAPKDNRGIMGLA